MQLRFGHFFSNSRPRMEKMARHSGGHILDIGFADIPNPFLTGSVIGVDLQAVSRPLNYQAVVIGDLREPFLASGAFDTIVAGEVIEHLEEPIEFLRNCRRLLRSGGRLVLSTPNPYYPPVILLNWLMIRKFFFASDHQFEIGPRFMVRLLERSGFRSVRVVSGGVVIPLGRRTYLSVPAPRAICYQMIYVAVAG
jgi:SAM-dependent methyltransferase